MRALALWHEHGRKRARKDRASSAHGVHLLSPQKLPQKLPRGFHIQRRQPQPPTPLFPGGNRYQDHFQTPNTTFPELDHSKRMAFIPAPQRPTIQPKGSPCVRASGGEEGVQERTADDDRWGRGGLGVGSPAPATKTENKLNMPACQAPSRRGDFHKKHIGRERRIQNPFQRGVEFPGGGGVNG